MKTSAKRVFIVIAALIVGVVLYTTLNKQQSASPIVANEGYLSPALSSMASGTPNLDSVAVPTSVPPTDAATAHVDFGAELRRSTNYYSFIRDTLMAAQAGDRDAAYYVAAALEYCDDTHRYFFERKGKVLTVEEAVAERGRIPGKSTTEEIRRADRRCHEVYEARNPPWGTSAAWMAQAADAGQPVAQVRTATAALLAINSPDMPVVRIVGRSNEVGSVDDARELVRLAVASKDPDALFQASDLLHLLNPDMPDEEVAKEGLAWKYAACLRGADCSMESEFMFQACLYDPNCGGGENGLYYLQNTAAAMQVFDLETRANVVLTRIDEKAWSELGLGASTAIKRMP